MKKKDFKEQINNIFNSNTPENQLKEIENLWKLIKKDSVNNFVNKIVVCGKNIETCPFYKKHKCENKEYCKYQNK